MTAITTFRQYATALKDAVRAEYGVTVAEVDELYPDDALRPEWMAEVLRLAGEGHEVPASVARTMSEGERYAVSKFGYSFNVYV